MDISSANVSFWENGLNVPNVTNLKNLSTILAVSIDWLENGEAPELESNIKPRQVSVNLWEIPPEQHIWDVDCSEIQVPMFNPHNRMINQELIDRSISFPVHKHIFDMVNPDSKQFFVHLYQDNLMSPSINAGDHLLLESDFENNLFQGDIYLLSLNNRDFTVARIKDSLDSKLISVDSEYPQTAVRVPDSEWSKVSVLGRVIFRFGAL